MSRNWTAKKRTSGYIVRPFPGLLRERCFSARVTLEEMEADAYRMNRYADGVYLNAEYLDGYEYLGESDDLEFGLYRLRMELSRRLRMYLPRQTAGVEAAMLLGDKIYLDDQVEDTFRVAGVSHLLAVSGLHVALLCGLLVSERDIRRRFFQTTDPDAGGFADILYGVDRLPGIGSPRRMRFSHHAAGTVLIQPPDALTSMGLVAIVLGMQNAYFPCDLGFQLSFSAVLGVQAASAISRWEDRTLPQPETERGELLRGFALSGLGTLQCTVLASLATLPVSACP